MSDAGLPEEELMQLLLQLKKTTPDSARRILNAQPQIAYALITLMIKLNLINFEVLQKTLTTFGTSQSTSIQSSPTAGVPSHAQVSSSSQAPQHHTPDNAYGNAYQIGRAPPNYGQTQSNYATQPSIYAASNHGYPNNTGYQNSGYPTPSGPPQPQTTSSPASAAGIHEALATFPEEQRAMILRVIQMTPEQINALSPPDRASILQLRATLGIP